MKEQLINIETAKLAKEKGFKTTTVSTNFTNQYLLGGKSVLINEMCIYLWMCELQKWLREEHNIEVYVVPIHAYQRGTGVLYKFAILGRVSAKNIYNYCLDTYEQALEKALQEGLKLI